MNPLSHHHKEVGRYTHFDAYFLLISELFVFAATGRYRQLLQPG